MGIAPAERANFTSTSLFLPSANASLIAPQSSKEEADLAYSAFLFQSNNIAAQVHNAPKDV